MGDKNMIILVKTGKHLAAAAEMAIEFRMIRKEAKQALLDRDKKNFKMYAAQLKSLLEMEFQDQTIKISQDLKFDYPLEITLKIEVKDNIWAKKVCVLTTQGFAIAQQP